MKDLTLLDSYLYDLPEELIASKPLEKRDQSRLLVINREARTIEHKLFSDLPSYIHAGDQLVFNNSKVIKARLTGNKATGAKVEVMLHKEVKPGLWECLVKPGRKMPLGAKVIFSEEFSATVETVQEDGSRLMRFHTSKPFFDMLERYGEIPLPHYMKRDATDFDDNRYQTVYAEKQGSVAAPTAGLHFTEEMLDNFKASGVDIEYVTLHVGWGTFKPVQTKNLSEHKMHSEIYEISDLTAKNLNACKKRRFAIGSTSCRTLESALKNQSTFSASQDDTNLFITPGYDFKAVDSLITNFHLPGSTLLMLISAFGGYDLIMEAYRQAVKERYRFFSYGDAMLIL